MTASKSLAPDYDVEYSAALEIAKQALGYVGRFHTPPTPEVYQLWYRFVEGKHAELCREMAELVEAHSLPLSQLLDIGLRHFPTIDNADASQRASSGLASEIASLQLLLQDQSDAGRVFDKQVSATSQELQQASANSQMLQRCINDVLASNARMQTRLAETDAGLTSAQQQIRALQSELRDAQKALFVDPLTGVGNRRLFEAAIEQALESSRKTAVADASLCVLTLLDIDNFKRINDTFGHAAADQILRFFADSMQRLGEDATIARLGGDEFAVLHRVEAFDEADLLAQQLLDFFDSTQLVLQPKDVAIGQLSASLGVAVLRNEDDRHSWFERADKLLYGAKRGGRKQVLCEPALGR